MVGRLKAIAIRPARKAPMRALEAVSVSASHGLEGDHAGKSPDRLVTVMSTEAWQDALDALDPPLEAGEHLDWTLRRANLLTVGAALPRAKGGIIRIGELVLEVTGQTWPCKRMEEARPGLLKALARDWRGGVTCSVRDAGPVASGDAVEILLSPPEVKRRLP